MEDSDEIDDGQSGEAAPQTSAGATGTGSRPPRRSPFEIMMEDPETQQFADSLRDRGLPEWEVEMRVVSSGTSCFDIEERIEFRRQLRAARDEERG